MNPIARRTWNDGASSEFRREPNGSVSAARNDRIETVRRVRWSVVLKEMIRSLKLGFEKGKKKKDEPPIEGREK